MFKKVVSLVVGISCAAAAMGVSAVTVSTSSTYGTDGTINVKTEVGGVNGGDVLTYLAYAKAVSDLEMLEGNQIVYIDQQTVPEAETTYNFQYVTDQTDIEANVKVGGIVNDSAITPSDDILTGPVCMVTINGDTSSVAVPYAESGFVKVAYALSGDITAISVNGVSLAEDEWFVAADGIWVAASKFTDNAATMTITEDSTSAAAIDTLALGYLNADTYEGDAIGRHSVIAAGQIAGYSADYGILFGASEADVTKYTNLFDQGGNAYPALGKGTDGKFTVKLYDFNNATTNPFTGNVAYARTYCKTGENTYVYGSIYQVDISGGSDTKGEEVKQASQSNVDLQADVFVDLTEPSVNEPVEKEASTEVTENEVAETVDEIVEDTAEEAELVQEPVEETEEVVPEVEKEETAAETNAVSADIE
ncbi:hypothetical protein [Ructibacterium gallinarum]|uniref:Uncharacterized protein n=1 Tax=Ructibacterium gallinarum TaxID=2779355 RepID=A0A9D5M146_9FIRM|nr:hypothetical protein [Ructibacterium gallinarum]MBE5039518.1 hypothetical protein [Ructibacterium gallinarum]